ncbi:hypothetical protein HGRIS_014043 [Hohenbuehelia grisea]|uniref:Uncharacterized protein n=1 Tax=Hohenbuehelia grisea TaxID=104357 RepID=A0ABR3JSC5_9AGAR
MADTFKNRTHNDDDGDFDPYAHYPRPNPSHHSPAPRPLPPPHASGPWLHQHRAGTGTSAGIDIGAPSPSPSPLHEMQPMLPVSEPSTVSSKLSLTSHSPLLASNVEAGQSSIRLLSGTPNDTSDRSSSSSSGSTHTAPSMSLASPPMPHSEPGPSSGPLWEQARRSMSAASFAPSPLNPAPLSASAASTPPTPFARLPGSSRGSVRVTRIASEDSRALSGYFGHPASAGTSLSSPSPTGNRGSMILYRLVDPLDDSPLTPPSYPGMNRASIISTDSALSLSSDSKYPSGMMTPTERGVVAYSYDPEADDDDDDSPDALHDPKLKLRRPRGRREIPWRGLGNITMLLVLIGALMVVFVLLPAIDVFKGNEKNARITGNPRINSTGQAFPVMGDGLT